MLKFHDANLELTDTPLKSACAACRAVRRETGVPDLDIMWHGTSEKVRNRNHLAQRGTGGYHAFAGFDNVRKTHRCPLQHRFDIDNLGLHTPSPNACTPNWKPSQRRKFQLIPRSRNLHR